MFVNPLFTDKIDGLRRNESDALLGVIHQVAIQPERLVRWHWRGRRRRLLGQSVHDALCATRIQRAPTYEPSGTRG